MNFSKPFEIYLTLPYDISKRVSRIRAPISRNVFIQMTWGCRCHCHRRADVLNHHGSIPDTAEAECVAPVFNMFRYFFYWDIYLFIATRCIIMCQTLYDTNPIDCVTTNWKSQKLANHKKR